MHKNKGQTMIEYIIIIIIILGVMVAMKNYVKRGIQGRWKSATDDLGEQYDPTVVNTNIMYSTYVNSESVVAVQCGELPDGTVGQWTNRLDLSNSIESKTGFTQVGS